MIVQETRDFLFALSDETYRYRHRRLISRLFVFGENHLQADGGSVASLDLLKAHHLHDGAGLHITQRLGACPLIDFSSLDQSPAKPLDYSNGERCQRVIEREEVGLPEFGRSGLQT